MAGTTKTALTITNTTTTTTAIDIAETTKKISGAIMEVKTATEKTAAVEEEEEGEADTAENSSQALPPNF